MTKKMIHQYVCQSCGSTHSKWTGKCVDCNQWNSLVEQVVEKVSKSQLSRVANTIEISNLDISGENYERMGSGILEFDRVLGGGFVRGSAILLGGDPGIGKSTLVLQLLSKLATKNHQVLYISGEESIAQIAMRAKRLKLKADSINAASLTEVHDIKTAIKQIGEPDLVVIDSIQTLFDANLDSAPGSVSQVRTCAFELIRMAKDLDITLFIIGHVTKEGAIAGPKVLEHMVDTVLYFEGDKGQGFRIIRAIKNRFGGANEIAIFEMSDTGLSEVSNPSSLFLPDPSIKKNGSAIFASLEGSRPLLLEIQALVVPSYLPSPRRAVIGWDTNRLAMIIAVLNARGGVNLLDKEVYLNITGGIQIDEPAVDMAVAAALYSAFKKCYVPHDMIFLGEIGLSGEIRNINGLDIRVNEAEKLGFKKAIVPFHEKKMQTNIDLCPLKHITELLDFISK